MEAGSAPRAKARGKSASTGLTVSAGGRIVMTVDGSPFVFVLLFFVLFPLLEIQKYLIIIPYRTCLR
jgi:hypothetical protein